LTKRDASTLAQREVISDFVCEFCRSPYDDRMHERSADPWIPLNQDETCSSTERILDEVEEKRDRINRVTLPIGAGAGRVTV